MCVACLQQHAHASSSLYSYVVSEKDVMDVEKTYWALKGSSGKFDVETLKHHVSPLLPEELVPGEGLSCLTM